MAFSSSGASAIVSTGLIIADFHPTIDRLNSPFLRFLMGGQAIGALKVPPKL